MNDQPENIPPDSGLPWRAIGWSAALGLFLLPLVAMQFTSEVQWTVSDFVFAGTLIGGVGLAFEYAVRIAPDRIYLMGFAVTLAVTFFLIWINAAVGIIGAAVNDVNFLYGFVLLLGVLVGLIGRFRARAMALAASATALAQALLTTVTLVAGWGQPANSALELLAINGMFIGGWLFAAALFELSVRQRSAEPSS